MGDHKGIRAKRADEKFARLPAQQLSRYEKLLSKMSIRQCVALLRRLAEGYMTGRRLLELSDSDGQPRRIKPNGARGAKDVLWTACRGFAGYAATMMECPDSRQWDETFKTEFANAKARFEHANARHAKVLLIFMTALSHVIDRGRAAGMTLSQAEPLAKLKASPVDESIPVPEPFAFLSAPIACEVNWDSCQSALELLALAEDPGPASVGQGDKTLETAKAASGNSIGKTITTHKGNRRRGRTPIDATADHYRWHKAYCDARKAGGRVNQKELARGQGARYPEFRRVIKRLESRRKTQK